MILKHSTVNYLFKRLAYSITTHLLLKCLILIKMRISKFLHIAKYNYWLHIINNLMIKTTDFIFVEMGRGVCKHKIDTTGTRI